MEVKNQVNSYLLLYLSKEEIFLCFVLSHISNNGVESINWEETYKMRTIEMNVRNGERNKTNVTKGKAEINTEIHKTWLIKLDEETLPRISYLSSVELDINRFFVFRCWRTAGFSVSCGIYPNGRSRRARRYITAASPSFSAQLLLASFCTRQLSIGASARICSTLTDFSRGRACQRDATLGWLQTGLAIEQRRVSLCRWLCFPQPSVNYSDT